MPGLEGILLPPLLFCPVPDANLLLQMMVVGRMPDRHRINVFNKVKIIHAFEKMVNMLLLASTRRILKIRHINQSMKFISCSHFIGRCWSDFWGLHV
jgi:hypothetical protein